MKILDTLRNIFYSSSTLRKKEQLDISLKEDIDDKNNGLDSFKLNLKSIPFLSYKDIDLSSFVFDHKFSYPFMISSMIGGTYKSNQINKRLAYIASTYNIPIGIGSCKIALKEPKYKKFFDIRKNDPLFNKDKLFLIANIGIDLLSQSSPSDCLSYCSEAIEMMDANALSIHINPLQELIQKDGCRSFRSIEEKIALISSSIKVPLIIKEVGIGLDIDTIVRLINMGIKYIDIGGKGGTNWIKIEGLRLKKYNRKKIDISSSFINEGFSTAEILENISNPNNSNYISLLDRNNLIKNDIHFIATGGVRTGAHIFKTLALGASLSGIGLGFLKHATSIKSLINYTDSLIKELKVSMILTNSSKIEDITKDKIIKIKE